MTLCVVHLAAALGKRKYHRFGRPVIRRMRYRVDSVWKTSYKVNGHGTVKTHYNKPTPSHKDKKTRVANFYYDWQHLTVI